MVLSGKSIASRIYPKEDLTWEGRVRPTFRPDAVTDLTTPGWRENVDAEEAGEMAREFAHGLEREAVPKA